MHKCSGCIFTNRALTCRASSRTGEGSSDAPLDPPASLSEYSSSRGWVTRLTHSCNSQHGPSGPPSTPPPGDDASPSLRAGSLQLWESSCGVLMPGVLCADVDPGCWRRSWISGRGACVETNAPKRVRLDTRTFTSTMGGRDGWWIIKLAELLEPFFFDQVFNIWTVLLEQLIIVPLWRTYGRICFHSELNRPGLRRL